MPIQQMLLGTSSGSKTGLGYGSVLFDGTTGNRTLASRGLCTILFREHNYCYISGAGLS